MAAKEKNAELFDLCKTAAAMKQIKVASAKDHKIPKLRKVTKVVHPSSQNFRN